MLLILMLMLMPMPMLMPMLMLVLMLMMVIIIRHVRLQVLPEGNQQLRLFEHGRRHLPRISSLHVQQRSNPFTFPSHSNGNESRSFQDLNPLLCTTLLSLCA
jgi:hypothetical protein